MGKGSGGTQKLDVTDYYMSQHWGFCNGPVDALIDIAVGEKSAWSGVVSNEQQIALDNANLFGGNKKEGGILGIAHYMPGGPTQTLADYLALRMGLSSTTAPGYRGISSIFFTGGTIGGFKWASNNPYLRSVWARMRRAPKVLDPSLRSIGNGAFSVGLNVNSVTVDGVTATVTPGVTQQINGHSIMVSGQSLVIDGSTILTNIVTSDSDDTSTITIDGAEYDASAWYVDTGTAVVSVNSVYVSGDIQIANITVTFNGTIDANPAAMIYEAYTNTDWGIGMAPSMINTQSFTDAATQLKSENFGMSMLWTQQTDAEEFVNEVLDHILATIFVNPRDGKLTIKLIRNDYDPDTLPVLTLDNCHVTGFDRKGWGETVNEIVVTWTNPVNEQDETVVAQDLANIIMQGSIISDSRNYHGVRNPTLAMQLARRDLSSAAAPVAAFEIEVDRSAWAFVPGGCVKLNYPEYGIDGVILRIMKIDYGKAGAPTIKVNASEDIFSLPQADYDDPDSTAWLNPAVPPAPLDHLRMITAPGYFVSAALRAADVDALQWPSVLIAFLAASTIRDTTSYELVGQETQPNGDVVGDSKGTKALLAYVETSIALVPEASTLLLSFGSITSGTGPRPGGFVFIGNVAEGAQEIALIQSYSGDSGWLLLRGVLDTVPRAWPIGTAMWFTTTTTNFLDVSTVYSAAETVVYRLLPSTSLGELPLADAPNSGAILTARPHLPNRPANVTVAGTAFGSVDISATLPTTVPVTWANRNRTMEDAQVLGWTEATIPPEDGQTTTVRLLDTDGVVITEHSGLTGTSFDIPIASFGTGHDFVDVRLVAVRAGLESLQGMTIRVKVNPAAGDPGDPNPGNPAPGDPGGDADVGDYHFEPRLPPPGPNGKLQ